MREVSENRTSTYRTQSAARLLLLALVAAVFVRLFAGDLSAEASFVDIFGGGISENNTTSANATEIAPKSNSGNETAEPEVTATPTPESDRKGRLKTLAAERYALGVILAGAISIGMLIVLFRYWTRRSGGRKE